jgi:hypothetical protein
VNLSASRHNRSADAPPRRATLSESPSDGQTGNQLITVGEESRLIRGILRVAEVAQANADESKTAYSCE